MKAKLRAYAKTFVTINGKLVLQDPKTKGSQRSVSLTHTATEALKKHRIKQYEQKLEIGENYQDQDLIIATRFGTPIGPRNLLRSFYHIIEQNHLTKIRFHEC
ncbi:hypothetical protein [Shimazuella alba]|uniref:Uncharacterized protein n=1 Tax=Shimazuella alba TaxID=2690964 RepID=A0A6I4VUZ8_9BACL|nr:hypothetical protein [Shimazuella alba]MXQ55669.1 hypothetical protein [Shimazuella alba]